MTDDVSGQIVRRYGNYSWAGVLLHPYKDDGAAPFKDITRQTLFTGPHHAGELRYFEMASGGHSTLERHEHVHGVMIMRGKGQALVADTVYDVRPFDLVTVPPMTWHQFRANKGEPLGFLCLVNALRDKPQLPTAEQLGEMLSRPALKAFLGG